MGDGIAENAAAQSSSRNLRPKLPSMMEFRRFNCVDRQLRNRTDALPRADAEQTEGNQGAKRHRLNRLR